MLDFSTGFAATASVLLRIAGGVAAVLLAIIAVLLFLAVASALFDLVTICLAKRWVRKGRKPRSRMARIILESHSKDGDKPG